MFKKKSSLREVWDSSVKKGSSVSIARKSSKEQHTKTQTLTWTEKVAPEGGSCPQGLHRLSRNPVPKADLLACLVLNSGLYGKVEHVEFKV